MTTFSLQLLPASSPVPLDVLQAVVTTPAATPAGEPTRYLIRAVTQAGTVLATYPRALANWIEWTENDAEGFEVEVPVDDDISPFDPPNEIQIWRNGHLLVWGRVTRRRATAGSRTWTLTCKGLLDYFKRRHMDKGGTGLTDLLSDAGNFEGTDLADEWTVSGSGVTVTADTTIRLLDAKSAKLVGDSTNGDRYISKQFVVTSTAIGVAVFLSGYLFVETLTDDTYQQRGLLIGYYDAPGDPFLKAHTTAAIKLGSTPTGSWQRFDTVVHLPPGDARLVEVRVQIPYGTLYADALKVRVMESFSMIAANAPDGIGWDQVDIVQQIFKFLQGGGFFGVGNNKSDLGIATLGGPSGVVKHRTYQFFDHQRGYSGPSGSGAADEFLRTVDGVDIRVFYSPTSRWLEVFYPSIGTARTTWRFRWVRHVSDDGVLPDDRWGIQDWTYEDTIDGAANDVTELSGWGTGVGREEGGYTNLAAFGGLTMELVESAPQDSPLDLLDDVAEARGAQLERPLSSPTFTIAEPRHPTTQEVTETMIGVLMPGDTIPLTVLDGALQMDGDYRVARVRLDCRTDLLAVVPNPVPV